MRLAVFSLTALLASAALAPVALQAQPAGAAPQTPPLIARTAFFGNPTRTAAQLSPDGKWLSWIAPRDGVLNVWVAPADNADAAKPLTAEKLRPIRQHFWARDSNTVMFINDKGGDENFLLYGVDVASGRERALTPFEKTRVQIVGTSNVETGQILVGLNNRDPRWHDVHRLDTATGKLTLVFQNDGYAGFVADEALNLRVAVKSTDDGGSQFFRVADGKVEAQPFETVGAEDARGVSPVGFTADGKTLYWRDSRGRDTAALVAQDWASGRKTVLAQNPRADIAGVLLNPKTQVADAYSVNYLKNEWTGLDPAVQADLAVLRLELKGEFGLVSRTDADDAWIVVNDPVTAPATYYRFDRATDRLTKLFTTRPELEGAALAPMTPLEIKSRDGKTLVSYLTLPAGSDPDGDGRPSSALPMVLLVHGGPWARDGYGYNGSHQWLANRGYAVLSVNYRGSTGFGKAFVTAGDGEWAGKMHDDLIDAVDHAVKGGVADPAKVAIMGGSYGGYATLVGLTFTPDRFACGVDIVGPSNLSTLLSTVPAYWTAGLAQMHRAMGKPGTPEGDALLRDRSPVFRADQIKRPLLIGQGANDPRVKQAESDQIVAAMAAKNIPVTYVLFPDEGHGFSRPVNNIAFNAVAETFLGKCLGGRSEPFGQSLAGSTIKVQHGAEFSPGLQAALGSR